MSLSWLGICFCFLFRYNKGSDVHGVNAGQINRVIPITVYIYLLSIGDFGWLLIEMI